jgi:hypothetical protein
MILSFPLSSLARDSPPPELTRAILQYHASLGYVVQELSRVSPQLQHRRPVFLVCDSEGCDRLSFVPPGIEALGCIDH